MRWINPSNFSGMIVAVEVTEQASDNGLLRPLVEKTEANTLTAVERVLVDAGYSDAEVAGDGRDNPSPVGIKRKGPESPREDTLAR
jgi:hypothetical protein